jgi:hypothetical protein
MIWDFVVEPVITIPLAAMSILNSSVFCGTLDTAAITTQRMWASCKELNAYKYAFFSSQLSLFLQLHNQNRITLCRRIVTNLLNRIIFSLGHQSYLVCILFCFTHVAVAVRTWSGSGNRTALKNNSHSHAYTQLPNTTKSH